jgi:hypothetical protein
MFYDLLQSFTVIEFIYAHLPRKGLKRYPFDATGGKRYKRKARFPALPGMRPNSYP